MASPILSNFVTRTATGKGLFSLFPGMAAAAQSGIKIAMHPGIRLAFIMLFAVRVRHCTAIVANLTSLLSARRGLSGREVHYTQSVL